MAANLATINGRTAMMYLDATPWHGTGQKLRLDGVAKHQLIDVAMDAAQLNYTVGGMPMFLADGSQVPGHQASARFGADGVTVEATLGVVGEAYRFIQNRENVDILRPLAEEYGCLPAAGGALDDGKRAWMLMRLANATVTPVDGDDVRGYFLLHWDHVGQQRVTGLGTGIRVVCQNTLDLATRGRKAWVAIKHSSSASQRLDEAAVIMRQLMAAMAETGDTFRKLAETRMDARALARYIEAAIPNTSASSTVAPVIAARRDTVARLVFAGKGAQMANQLVNVGAGEASAWAAYNAVAEYMDHVRPAEAKSDAGRLNAQTSAVFGANAEIKAAALDLARQLVAA